MHRTIVIAFSTVDGVIEDPDGTDGTPRFGPIGAPVLCAGLAGVASHWA